MLAPDLVLLIEDDPHIRELIVSALECDSYKLITAGTAARGMHEAVQQKPQLLLLDLGLPDRDGLEFIRDFRGWSSIPILVISARTQESQVVAALDAGADDYLTKPFGVSELLARVRAQLRRAPVQHQESTPLIQFGDFTINCVTREVLKGGQLLHLSQIEYRLLQALAANPGRVMTHRQLLVQVWGGQASANHEYLRVYVGHLRQKIEATPGKPRHILTEIGVGYRFQL
ncbi:response regulator [Propionivibrio limicola]|uniref:response regulator n=1 Tax=Propionivibrio limicola TaxID=167645 RepID=UPI001291B8D6|nr:response regulator [Propionivibrio limicola]